MFQKLFNSTHNGNKIFLGHLFDFSLLLKFMILFYRKPKVSKLRPEFQEFGGVCMKTSFFDCGKYLNKIKNYIDKIKINLNILESFLHLV